MVSSSNNPATAVDTPPPTQAPSKPQKYLFDTEFDYSETVEDIQSITPKQLAEVKAQTQESSYDDGYKKGTQDTNNSITRTAGDQLFVITGKIEELIQSETMILEMFHTQVAQISELVTSKVLPALAEQGALEEVKSILDEAQVHLPKEKNITIEVQEPLVDLITKHITDGLKTEDSTAQITIIAGENFQATDCKISWEGAGIEHYMDNVMAEVKKSLLRLGGEDLTLPVDSPPDHESHKEKENIDESTPKETNTKETNKVEAE